MMQTFSSLWFVIFGAVAAPAFVAPQQTGDGSQQPAARPSSQVAAQHIAIAYYRPQWTDPGTLSNFIHEVHSPAVEITNADGELERRLTALMPKQAVILVRGSQAQVEFLMSELARFDEALRVPKAKDDSKDAQEELVQFEYQPRFSDAEGLFNALETFVRPIELRDVGGSQYVTNITYVPSHGLLIVREMRERAEEIKALLERLDQPAAQFTVEYLVIEGSASADTARKAPADLAEHLARMLPFEHFNVLNSGLLHGTAREPMKVNFESGEDRVSMNLELSPASFDQQSGTLTLRRCAFRYDTVANRRGFDTGASLSVDEFTVIGAAGSEGTLLALRLRLK